MLNGLIAVTGATGRQGRSVIDELLNRGYRIRALVRDPAKAGRLKQENIEFYQGDLRDPLSLQYLLRDADGIFFALPLTRDALDLGRNLLNAAQASGVRHIVFSSVGGADRSTKVKHFAVKREIEERLRNGTTAFTILRPAGYMEDFANPKSIKVFSSLLRLYLPPTRSFQMIALRDIGRFSGMVFDDPERYGGREIEIAGDQLTLDELLDTVEKVKGMRVKPLKIPGLVKRLLTGTTGQMLAFIAEDGWKADIAELKQENPRLLSFEDWLKTTDFNS